MYKLFKNVIKPALHTKSNNFRLLRRYTPRNDGTSNGEGLHRHW